MVGYPCNGSDCLRIPIFLLVIVALHELASETQTALALFLLLVLLLVLLHLELHHLHLPDAVRMVSELNFEALGVIDLVFIWLAEFIDVATLASNNDL